MPTNFQKREKRANQSDAVRGQRAMDRLTGVVKREQRFQAKSGTQATDTTFNSQPQAGWKKEWKTTMASKVNSSIGPDAAWTDEQAWLQGSRKCYDSRKPVPTTQTGRHPNVASSGTMPVDGKTGDRTASARQAAGYASVASSATAPGDCKTGDRTASAKKSAGYPSVASSATAPGDCKTGDGTALARKSASALPSLPVLPEQVSRTACQKYVVEVNAAIQHALLDPSIRADTDELHRYTAELAGALRVLTKPAPASKKTQICEAMASVWDMRSNSAPTTGAPLDLRTLADALEALEKCCSSEDVMQAPASTVEKT